MTSSLVALKYIHHMGLDFARTCKERVTGGSLCIRTSNSDVAGIRSHTHSRASATWRSQSRTQQEASRLRSVSRPALSVGVVRLRDGRQLRYLRGYWYYIIKKTCLPITGRKCGRSLFCFRSDGPQRHVWMTHTRKTSTIKHLEVKLEHE